MGWRRWAARGRRSSGWFGPGPCADPPGSQQRELSRPPGAGGLLSVGEQLPRQVVEERAGAGLDRAAKEAAPAHGGEHQTLLRARDADVEQAALFVDVGCSGIGRS
jgi:hypothetical protein